jgi:hypothetical protein
MSDDISSIDGHVFRTAEERERYVQFMREEGRPLLAAYSAISCPGVRAAVLHLIKVVAVRTA